MAKYEFVKKDEDTTTLKYKNKEFAIVRDIDLATKIQNINFRARSKMIKDLAKDGMTTDDLIAITIKNGKKYENEASLRWMEKKYLLDISLETFDEICNKYTKMSMVDLMGDIGITEDEEGENFGKELKNAIMGTSTPREK